MTKLKNTICLVIIVLLPLWSAAQCSVCSAVVSSSAQNGGGVSKGINHAIMYLMSFPYIILAAFLAYRYRDYIAFQFRTLIQRWRML